MQYLKAPGTILIIISFILAFFNIWAGIAMLVGCIAGAIIGIQGTWKYIQSRFKLEPRILTDEDVREAPKL